MKIIKGAAVVVAAVVAILILFLVGSVLVDAVLGTERINQVSNMLIPGANGGPDVHAYVARPQGQGPFPVVIMIHEFFGLNSSITGRADGLAEQGYLVVAPDTFRGSTTAWIPRAIYQVVSNKPEQVNTDLDSVFAWIETQPDAIASQVGIAGFCYGGRTSLLYSLHNPQLAATVIFYGSPVTDAAVLKSLPGPVLGIYGGADQSIPAADVHAFEQALNQAGVEHEISIYEGQPHAFITGMPGVLAGGVQAQAWEQMLVFLDKHLKQGGSSRTGSVADYQAPFEWRYYLMLAYEHTLGSASHSMH